MTSSDAARTAPKGRTETSSSTDELEGRTLRELQREPRALPYIAVLLVVISVFTAVRFRLRNMPLERDEGDYAYVGQLMLQGVLPFKLAGNLKLPGPYLAYALIMAIFGQSAGAIHIGLLLMNAATAILIFLLGKQLYGPLCGTVAGCAYSMASTRLSVLGLQAHATHFVVLFAVAGLICYLQAIESRRNTWLLFSGFLLGTAYVMKQPGILFPLFAGLDLLRRDWKFRRERQLASRFAVYMLGAVLPFLLTCVVMLANGTFRRFWFWTVSYASAHANLVSLSEGWQLFRDIFFTWIIRPHALWLVAVCGLLTLFWERPLRSRAVFVGGFVLFSFLAVCPGLYFRPHYFILLLPAVSLLAGIAVSAASDRLQRRPVRFLPAWLPAVACLMFLAVYSFGQRRIFWKMTPMEVLEDEYPGGLFRQAFAAGDYLKSHLPEGQQIAVLGSEPEICFYAQRRSASSYIHIQAFSEKQPYADRMQREMISEIEAAQPMAVVDVNEQDSWGYKSELRPPNLNPAFMLAWKREFLSQHYELAKVFPFDGDTAHIEPPVPRISVYLKKQQ